jgi:hypothetical protein
MVLARAGNLFFDLGDKKNGFRYMAESLKGYRGAELRNPRQFFDYDRRHIPVEDVVRYGLPDDADVARGYFHWHIDGVPDPNYPKIWPLIVERGYVDDELAEHYVSYLLKKSTPDAAWQAWTLYASRQESRYPDANLVFNGGFERKSTLALFDWQMWSNGSDAEVSVDDSIRHQGNRSFRIHFGGKTNINYNATTQTVGVSPGTYRFRAFIRADGLTTDRGIEFQLSDAENWARFHAQTQQVTGTTDWALIEQTIRVPQGVRLLNVQLRREASLKFDSNIAGTAWIDDVSLVPVRESHESQ